MDRRGRPGHLGRCPDRTLAVGQGFVDAYKAAGYKEPYEAYGGYSYDAANAIINALEGLAGQRGHA